jgi:hypothetical protein
MLVSAVEIGKAILHPNGFIQVPLNADSTLKLHVFPDIPLADDVADAYTIHDHVWDLESIVLMGELHHTVHEVELGLTDPELPRAQVWKLWEATDHCRNARAAAAQGGSILKETDVFGVTTMKGTRVLREGERYTFPRRQFHTTSNVGLTVTLMRKKTYPDAGEPRVLCRFGKTPDDALRSEVNLREVGVTLRRAIGWVTASPWAWDLLKREANYPLL